MQAVKCANGHFYDKDRYLTCPVCGDGEEAKQHRPNLAQLKATEISLSSPKIDPPQGKSSNPAPTFFVAKWMNWGYIQFDTDISTEELWTIYYDRSVNFSRNYAVSGQSKIISGTMEEHAFQELIALLTTDFSREKDDRSGCDGEGWEMVHYDVKGNIIYKYYGYIYAHPILNKIVELLDKCEFDEYLPGFGPSCPFE